MEELTGLTATEKELLFDGLKDIGHIKERLSELETSLKVRRMDWRFYIMAIIAFVGVAWAIMQPIIF